MKLLTDFLGLLYDLVIGDCWQIAAGAVVLLSVGVELLRADALPTSLFAAFLGGIIMIGSALIILFEARASYRRNVNGGSGGKSGDSNGQIY